MNERIQKIRKQLGLSQREFAKKIDIGASTLAMFETGDRKPKDIHINRICSEFGVNEVWLRTGEGGDENMFAKVNEDDRFSLNLGKLSFTENQIARNMLNAIAEASPEKLQHIEEFMKACLGID
ncbi:helix-turn-helix domain-containing protein [[Clostridium] scindens]|uniref:helix-turn-helix domain-containing protein n=1 Tax=Clostridium scindens (strain JCM 10418 / VPI 12708) TaxID=29347 RepID=UPI003AEF8790